MVEVVEAVLLLAQVADVCALIVIIRLSINEVYHVIKGNAWSVVRL